MTVSHLGVEIAAVATEGAVESLVKAVPRVGWRLSAAAQLRVAVKGLLREGQSRVEISILAERERKVKKSGKMRSRTWDRGWEEQ